MKRIPAGLSAAVLLFSIVLSTACGGNAEKQIDPREMQMQNLQAKITTMEAAVNEMQAQLNQAKNLQLQFADSVGGVQTALNQLQSGMAESRTALNTLSQVEQQKNARSGKRWPWAVRIILILALLVVFYFIWKKVVRGGDDEDENPEEGEIAENELGTVRYPGSKARNPSRKD